MSTPDLRANSPDPRPGLTPSEIIRLGIQQGHSADVILASLEAAGWVVVPVEEAQRKSPGESMGSRFAEIYREMLAARPK